LLAQARTDALAAAAAAKLLSGSSIADITANQALGPGVYFLAKIDLNSETLMLSGGPADSFVFNISDDFKLNSSDILLTGGVLPQNVLFNYFGTHDVLFSGGGNASELHGIILAPDRKVTLSPGLVIGEIISGDDISIVSGARVQGLTVPESTSTLLLSFISFGLLALLQSAVRRA
jgi:choice-of-anchor A domain-containing protein